MRNRLRFLFISALLFSPARAASNAVVFIDSMQPQQAKLAREIHHQLYFSQQLQRQLNVTIIDINPHAESLPGAATYLKDSGGVWAGKYRPAEIPALFCLNGKRTHYIKMASAREIRSCL